MLHHLRHLLVLGSDGFCPHMCSFYREMLLLLGSDGFCPHLCPLYRRIPVPLQHHVGWKLGDAGLCRGSEDTGLLEPQMLASSM